MSNSQTVVENGPQNRNNNLKKNIAMSFIFKLFSLGLSFFTVSLLIRYLNTNEYGVWLTLLSILSWVSFSDIGLGNGLRNRLTVAYSQKNYKDAREYVATTYAVIVIIVVCLYIILLIILPQLNLQGIFNTNKISNIKLMLVSFLALSFFLSNFVLSLYNQLYYAVQRASVTGLGQVLINLFYLLLLAFLTLFSKNNILFVSVCYGISLLTPSILLTILFFKKYKQLRPGFHDIKLQKIKDLMNLGIKFFIIQIAAVIYFGTNNIIITQINGPAQVGVYDTAFKLFNTVSTAFVLLLTPLWSAFTEAYAKNDFQWIREVIKKLNYLLIPLALGLVLMIVCSNFIFKLWIGNRLMIPSSLVILNAIYVFVYAWSNIYVYLMNGLNKLNLQLVFSIFTCFINIPLCFYFGKTLNLGVSGIMIAQILTALPGAIIFPACSIRFISKGLQGGK